MTAFSEVVALKSAAVFNVRLGNLTIQRSSDQAYYAGERDVDSDGIFRQP